ncbi:MAG: hypothetical protein ACXVA9_12540, partial [Bdellovibrionales bacterium]
MKMVFCLLLGVSFSVGCAGPMSPFGALELNQKKAADDSEQTVKINKSGARVRFTPDRQVLHSSTNFSVVIEDPEGVPDDFKLVVNFNGIDVTKAFMAHAKWTSLDPLNHEVRLSTKFLRLLPSQENRVQVTYWRTPTEKSATALYQPPSCSA